eukprot:12985-Heterococcus_DN1.PRE.2
MASTRAFKVPVRAIFSQRDVQSFAASTTYAEYLGFLKLCAGAVRGNGIRSSEYHVSAAVDTVQKMLVTVTAWIA